jgi:hypothetical protein
MRFLPTDVRQSVRSLRQNPGASLVAIGALAVAIGVNTTLFTLYDAIALKRLPVKHSATLVRLERWFMSGARGDVQFLFSGREYLYLREHTRAFSGIAASTNPTPAVCYLRGNATSVSRPEQFVAAVVSDNFFTVLGADATLGRVFRPDDAGKSEVVLSYPFWQRRFRSDPAVMGQEISVAGIESTVIGVAEPSFIGAGAPPSVPDLWLTRRKYPTLATATEEDNPQLNLLAQLNYGVKPSSAGAETELLIRQLARQYPAKDTTIEVTARSATYFATTDDFRFQTGAALVIFA